MNQTLSILLADADPELTRIIEEKLANHDLKVLHSANLEEIITLSHSGKIHFVLADQNVAGISGIELAERIHAVPSSHGHPLPETILMSNHMTPALLEKAHQAGVCFVAHKPFNYQEIQAVLEKYQPMRAGDGTRKTERVTVNPQALGQLYGQISMGLKKSEFDTTISNIGRGGFYFEMISPGATTRPPDVGQIIRFNLQLGMVPDARISGVGIVRWTKGKGAGVEFISLSTDSEALVRAFVSLFKVVPFVPNC